MNDNEWFVIDDLQKFVESTRVLVFDSFGSQNEKTVDELAMMLSELEESESEELETTLTQTECMVIAKKYLRKQINKSTNEERYVIDTNRYMEMIESFNTRMISNMLNNLSNRGLIESAYDSEANDFIFWIKDDSQKEQDQKPETD